jgi:hypothetical protein
MQLTLIVHQQYSTRAMMIVHSTPAMDCDCCDDCLVNDDDLCVNVSIQADPEYLVVTLDCDNLMMMWQASMYSAMNS